MGTGDWNDGMNRVGHEGRGESVWLAWFLCDVVDRFAPIAEQRGEHERARALARRRARLARRACRRRLGRRSGTGAPSSTTARRSARSANDECRIDLIAQAWAVLSGAAPEPRTRAGDGRARARSSSTATPAWCACSTRRSHIAEPSAGYIQAYPPGVRENGGQYSHAGVWALMAQAALGDADAAYRYFTYLSPAHRSRHPSAAAAYEIEPYVMAGDVYSAPPYVGRGGWSWYTGSAAWMHRAAIESMFGVAQRGDELVVRALPAERLERRPSCA